MTAVNFPCFLPKKIFKCVYAVLMSPFCIAVAERKSSSMLKYPNHEEPHQEEWSPLGYSFPLPGRQFQSCIQFKVHVWVGNVLSSPSGLDGVHVVVWWVGRRYLNLLGRHKRWTMARTESCPSHIHVTLLQNLNEAYAAQLWRQFLVSLAFTVPVPWPLD